MQSIVLRNELTDEVRRILVRQPAFAFGNQTEVGIGKARVPAGIGIRLIVESIFHIPAEHTVAEPTSLAHQGGELVHTDVFTADHPIDVDKADLHSGHTALFVGCKPCVETGAQVPIRGSCISHRVWLRPHRLGEQSCG